MTHTKFGPWRLDIGGVLTPVSQPVKAFKQKLHLFTRTCRPYAVSYFARFNQLLLDFFNLVESAEGLAL